MKRPSLQTFLQEVIQQNPYGLRAAVADEALHYHTGYGADPEQDLERFFDDLFRCGCVSGLIGSLIYYRDTHAFFDRHYDEIEELREEYEDSVGEPLRLRGDLKNGLAWFGFEWTAQQLWDEFEALREEALTGA